MEALQELNSNLGMSHIEWSVRTMSPAARYQARDAFFQTQSECLKRTRLLDEQKGEQGQISPSRWPSPINTAPGPRWLEADDWQQQEQARRKKQAQASPPGNEMMLRVNTQRWPGAFSTPGMAGRQPSPRYEDRDRFARTCREQLKQEQLRLENQHGTLLIEPATSSVGVQQLSTRPSAPRSIPPGVVDSRLSMGGGRWHSYAADRPQPNPIAKSSTDLGPAAFATHSSLSVGSNVSPKFPPHTPLPKTAPRQKKLRAETPDFVRRRRKPMPSSLKELNATREDDFRGRTQKINGVFKDPEAEQGKSLRWWMYQYGGDEPPKDAPQDNKSPQGKGRSARKKLFVTSKNDYLRSPR